MTVFSAVLTHSWIPGAAMLAESLAGLFAIEANDLVVTDPAGVVQVLGTDYEVTGNLRTGTASIRALRAYTAGVQLTVTRVTDRVQQAQLSPIVPLPAKKIETELDRRTLIEQEQDAIAANTRARALLVPDGETVSVLPGPAARRGKFIGFNPVTGLYDLLDGNGVADAASVTYVAAPAGAVGRTVKARLQELPLSVEDFRTAGATDTQALTLALAMAASTGRPVDVGGGNVTLDLRQTLIVTAPNVTIFGSGATIRMNHSALGFASPMIHVRNTATKFKSWGIKWDHNALGVAQPTLGNQLAFIYTNAVILGAPGFQFSGEVYNSWDNGVGVADVTFTGTGAAGSPVSATQVVGSPQSWVIGSVYGENCGCGVHNYAPAAEFGKKGSVVNVLTGSDGTIGQVTGKNNYNGLIVDFGGGGEASIGPCAFTGTIMDPAQPANGSGIDYYFGAGQIIAPSLKSDNAGRMGVAISDQAGAIVISARIHAPGAEGAVIEGGSVTGDISVSAPGQSANNTYDAVVVRANTTSTQINIRVTVLNPVGGGNKHRYAYSSVQGGGFTVRGAVRLVADAGVTGIINRAGQEVLSLAGLDNEAAYGVFGFGTAPLLNTSSRIFSGGDITIATNAPGFFGRLYYDTVSGQIKHLANGYGFVLKQDGVTGAITLQKSGNNTSGAGAVAALATVATW